MPKMLDCFSIETVTSKVRLCSLYQKPLTTTIFGAVTQTPLCNKGMAMPILLQFCILLKRFQQASEYCKQSNTLALVNRNKTLCILHF